MLAPGNGGLTHSRARLSTKSPYSSLSGSERPSRALNFWVLNGRCIMSKHTNENGPLITTVHKFLQRWASDKTTKA